MIKPAIIAVGYNRADSIKRLLESLEAADYPFDNIELIVSIDKSEANDEVVKVAASCNWSHGSKQIRTFPERQGLRRHIIQCGDLSEKYGAVIILEDDLYVSPSFYHYAYTALNHYENDERLAGISLYSHSWNGYANLSFTPQKSPYDVFYAQFSVSWGQCWSSKHWKAFKKWYTENENKLCETNPLLPSAILKWSNQSWGKYYISYMVENDKYYIVPYESMTTNFSEIGQHNTKTNCAYQVPLQEGVKKQYYFPTFENSVKYDLFFERIFTAKDTVNGISGDKICVNLNSKKSYSLNKEYLLSVQKLNFPIIASFGMIMRPCDANITNNVPGNDVFLYKLDAGQNIKLPVSEKRISEIRANYELYNYNFRVLLSEGLNRMVLSLKARLFH